jgi:hypothetical protein
MNRRWRLTAALLIACLGRGAAAQGTPADTSSKVWLGRHDEIERYLLTAPIQRITEVPIGITKPRRIFFDHGGPAASAIIKDLPPGRRSGFFESYRSEIAAYELDKLLELGMVPPTVERRIHGKRMSVQLWVEHCKLLKDYDQGQPAGDPEAWNRQVFRQRVFDNLIANGDRNAGNLLVDRVRNLILIDHSRAFTNTKSMPFVDQMTRIDRGLLERLRSLKPEEFAAILKPWLFDRGCGEALLWRRERILVHFEGLVAERGEAQVFLP